MITVAAQYQAQSTTPFHSEKEIKSFAAYLFSNGDFLRARSEYESLPQVSLNDTLRLRLAYCCLRTDDRKSAISIISSIKDTLAQNDLRRCILQTWFDEKDYTQIAEYGDTIRTGSLAFRNEIVPLVSVAKLLSGNAKVILPGTFTALNVSDRNSLMELQKRVLEPEHKSVLGAALLSAAVPGLGKIYTGRTGDGITAAIVTGLLGFLAFDNFNHDHDFRGYVFSVSCAVFYAGNIYGSAAAAQILNEENELAARDKLTEYVKSRNCFLKPASILLEGSK